MILKKIILVLLSLLLDHIEASIIICFPKPEESPIVTERSFQYIPSIHANMPMPEPVLAFICDPSGKLINSSHPLFNKYLFSITVMFTKPVDGFYPGRLEQIANNRRRYFSMDRFDAKQLVYRQPDPYNPTTLSSIPIKEGMLIGQGLIFTVATQGSQELILEFSVEYEGYIYKNRTNPFKVYEEIKGLVWTVQPKKTITANNPFNIAFEIIDKNDTVLQEFAFNLMVEVTLSYVHKYFFSGGSKLDFLHGTQARLVGKDAVVSKKTNDTALRKEVSSGQVSFEGVRILDHTMSPKPYTLQLNATLLIPKGNWFRVPFLYTDREHCPLNATKMRTAFLTHPNFKVIRASDSREDQIYTYNQTCLETIPNKGIFLSNGFYVKKQSAVYLDVKELKRKEPLQTPIRVTANFPLPSISLEILDTHRNRIYSGDDSELEYIVDVKLKTTNVVIEDALCEEKHRLLDGYSLFNGSFCNPNLKKVTICFRIKDRADILSNCTGFYSTTGDIHIGYFGNLFTVGTHSIPDPLLETFILFAMEDINNRVDEFANLLPAGYQIKVQSYNTKHDLIATMESYAMARELGKKQPHKQLRAIIGFGHNKINEAMMSFTNRDGIHVINVLHSRFSTKLEKLYTTLCWSEETTYTVIAKMFAQRNWLRIVILHSDKLDGHIYDIMRQEGIRIVADINIPVIEANQWSVNQIFESEMKKILSAGTKIILNFVRAPLQFLLFNIAVKYNVSGLHGYQWVSGEAAGLDFPVKNSFKICNQEGKPSCTEAMQGLMIIGGINKLNYESQMWIRVHMKFFHMDRSKYRGIPKSYDIVLASAYARAYDAVTLFTRSVSRFIKGKKTITGLLLSKYMHNQWNSFTGLTGRVIIDRNGRRQGFIGYVMSIYPGQISKNERRGWKKTNKENVRSEIVLQLVRYLFINTNGGEVIEVPHEANDYTKLYKRGPSWRNLDNIPMLAIMTLPREAETFSRKYLSFKGFIDDDTQNLVTASGYIISGEGRSIINRTDRVVKAFFCRDGCGGDKLSDDGLLYENGACVQQDICNCKTIRETGNISGIPEEYLDNNAYSGDGCTSFVCHECIHGSCQAPENCICDDGYNGSSCKHPMCPYGCGPGKCISPGVCLCPPGFMGNSCEIIVPVLLGPILIAVILFLFCLHHCFDHYKERQKMNEIIMATDWLVQWEDVHYWWQINELDESDMLKEGKKARITLPAEPYNPHVVHWQGHKCYAEFFQSDTIDLSNSVNRVEFIVLRQMNHPNIAIFIGASVKAPNVVLLTEYYPKGSLQDLLDNRTIPMDWDVKFSFLTDIAKGMEYLHASAVESHGRLKSSNCLIDNRWCIRLSGFGVRVIRSDGKKNQTDKNMTEALLWTAPELLRKHNTLESIAQGTPAGDVYSFAILTCEIVNENQPFGYLRTIMTAEDILWLLKKPNDPMTRHLKEVWLSKGGVLGEYPRPLVRSERLPIEPVARTGLETLIRKCWDEDPRSRPSFREITDTILSARLVKGDLVDLLIKRLETHSMKLEEQFVEASKELQIEKEKVEEILCRMLPKKIVDDLIHNKKIDAEDFESATVGFCDISDFVSMSKTATAFQIIELLNDLYAVFDSTIEVFDVYKVETVRDEYMVVSGLPVRNGFLHASEIATLALHLMAAINTFQIKYAPDRLLMLRIGIHTGPCVAGVVGYHMPRYCLFGDTINTASRMKSSSSALRIHISEDTNNILKVLGGFRTQFRGQRDVKGKGKMNTYWLVGKHDFNKPLPDIKLAVDESQQQFK